MLKESSAKLLQNREEQLENPMDYIESLENEIINLNEELKEVTNRLNKQIS